MVGEEVSQGSAMLIDRCFRTVVSKISPDRIFYGVIAGNYPPLDISADARSVYWQLIVPFIRAGFYEFPAAAPGGLFPVTQRS